MNRRKSISTIGKTALITGLNPIMRHLCANDTIIGHGDYKYKVDLNWGALNSNFYPVNDCHEMVIDRKGRIILLTNHTKNNILIYNKDGRLLDFWGTTYPGGHGLTISEEGEEEFLYIADNNRHQVIKTDLNGREILTLEWPKESEKYKTQESYIPTETTIGPNGDIYVADGYGAQYILHYNSKGELINCFGGRGTGHQHFENAHGICLDTRTPTPTLLITEREHNQLKRFSLNGEYIEHFDLPGCYICRPVIHRHSVYLATIWSGDKSENSGFISILNKENKLISAPGGIQPRYNENQLYPMRQEIQVFRHPHDVCIDQDDNIYVAQWNSGKTYPIKLHRT